MTRIIEDIAAYYETHEFPFGRSYEWHPGHIIVECDCGQKLTLTATSATTACGCGADYGALVHDIRHREERLRDEDEHPWHHEPRSQAEQHLRDEATYPEGSPWRYNDITSRGTDNEGSVQQYPSLG